MRGGDGPLLTGGEMAHLRRAFALSDRSRGNRPCGAVITGAVRLRHDRGDRLDQSGAQLSCRDVFAAAPQPTIRIGRVLAEEAAAVHDGAWKA